jgi:hypothetical protein
MWLTPFTSPVVQKAFLLLVPGLIWAILLVGRRFSAREYAASFLAYAWHFQTALLLNILFSRIGLWEFSRGSVLIYGVPNDMIMGEAFLLGGVNTLVLQRFGFVAQFFAGVVALSVIYALPAMVIPAGAPWPGIAALACLSLAPSLKLAEWTAGDRHVGARASLQSLNWVSLLLWLFPSIVFLNTGHSWQPLLDRPLWLTALILMPMLIPAALIFGALRQFAVEGDGTGFPYDPPKRLVNGGIYAYLSNPMQVGICLAMAWWGVVTASLAVSVSACVALLLFIVFKDVCNGSCAIGERDPNWALYQREVPRWFPRRTAWTPPK